MNMIFLIFLLRLTLIETENIQSHEVGPVIPVGFPELDTEPQNTKTYGEKPDTRTRHEYLPLILTPYLKHGRFKLAKKLSSVNRKKILGIESYAAFLTVRKEFNSNLFYWFFPVHKKKLRHTPWVIWLQGGPGISSLFGLMDLIGPIKIVNGHVRHRNVSWSDYSLLFIDNPVGAGFSFTESDFGYPTNEDDVGEQLYEFFRQFLLMFPELVDAPLFIAGESYAGKYIPALGIQIHRHRHKKPRINLKGLAIGNGLIDPETMLHYDKVCDTFGILGDKQLNHVRHLQRKIIHYIHTSRMVKAANTFNQTIEYIKKQSGVDIHNFIKNPTNSYSNFEKFLNRPDVRRWIHVGETEFNLDNQLVYDKMLPDIMNTTKPWVEELLEHYGVMSYSGGLDVIIGYGQSKYTNRALKWSQSKWFNKAPRKQIRRVGQSVIGYLKRGGNFLEVMVRNAGHMVPADQPENLKLIIDKFINDFK